VIIVGAFAGGRGIKSVLKFLRNACKSGTVKIDKVRTRNLNMKSDERQIGFGCGIGRVNNS